MKKSAKLTYNNYVCTTLQSVLNVYVMPLHPFRAGLPSVWVLSACPRRSPSPSPAVAIPPILKLLLLRIIFPLGHPATCVTLRKREKLNRNDEKIYNAIPVT